jgi:hypothetical protein
MDAARMPVVDSEILRDDHGILAAVVADDCDSVVVQVHVIGLVIAHAAPRIVPICTNWRATLGGM